MRDKYTVHVPDPRVDFRVAAAVAVAWMGALYAAVAGLMAVPDHALTHPLAIAAAGAGALVWAAQSHFYVGAIQSDTAHWERADSLLRTLGAARSRLSAYDRLHLDYVLAWRSMDRNAVYRVARRRALATPGSANAVREAGYNAIRLGHLREGIELLRRFDPTRGILRGHDSYWRHLTFAHHQAGEHRQFAAAKMVGTFRVHDHAIGKIHGDDRRVLPEHP